MTAFGTTTTNPGTGGASLATDTFTDTDGQRKTMPYSAVAIGEIGGPYAPIDANHPLPVTAAALPLPAGAATDATLAALPGTDGTGITPPAGAAGIRGWLSGIYKLLSGLLAFKLYDSTGANAAAVSSAGAVKVDGSAATQPISGTVLVSNSGFTASQSGAWTVAVSSVAGTVAASQSGAWTVSTTGTTTIAGTVTANQGGAPWSINTAQVGGANVSVGEGNSDTGTSRVSIGTDSGLLTFSKLSTADTNATTVKSSAGTLFRLEVFNTGAAPAYLRVYDKATAPNPATDTPKRRYTIPASTTGAGFVVEYLKGRPFANGIAYVVTGAVADNDATPIAAGQVVLNCDYK